ncbi:MAG: hypothetical protein WDO15_11260 [Bacteroidota bacterium]
MLATTTAKYINVKMLRFAKSRELSLKRHSHSITPRQVAAIAAIRNLMGSAEHYDVKGQCRCVVELRSSIVAILPSPYSRYKKLRAEIMELVEFAAGSTAGDHPERLHPHRNLYEQA